MLANHDQNIECRFRLAQNMFICKVGIKLKQGSIVSFGLARSIEQQARPIKAQAECFFADSSNSALFGLKHF